MSAREIRQSGEIDKPLPDIFRELEHLFFLFFGLLFALAFILVCVISVISAIGG